MAVSQHTGIIIDVHELNTLMAAICLILSKIAYFYVTSKQSSKSAHSVLPIAFVQSHIAVVPAFQSWFSFLVIIINHMKSCRVSICELRPSATASLCSPRRHPTRYTHFMKKVSHLNHSQAASSSHSHFAHPQTQRKPSSDVDFLLPSGNKRDEMFVLLKGKNFFTSFQQKPSKMTQTEPAQPYPLDSPRPKQHINNQKRMELRRKRIVKTIEREKMERQESEKRFLKKTLTVEMSLACKHCQFQ